MPDLSPTLSGDTPATDHPVLGRRRRLLRTQVPLPGVYHASMIFAAVAPSVALQWPTLVHAWKSTCGAKSRATEVNLRPLMAFKS